jgi:tripartite-type tricarboxylate transporter receptor subunit TctC
MRAILKATLAVLMTTSALSVCNTVTAEERYGCRNVRWIIPFAPGGGVDVTMRRVAEHLSGELGNVPVVIENRGGGSGALGTIVVRNSQADGCTILAVSSSITLNQAVRGAASNYDLVRDFDPVIQIVDMPYVIAVYPPTGITTVAEMVTHAKQRPGDLKCATSGSIGYQALSWAALAARTGIKLTPVAYKGGGDQFTDTVSGRIQLMLTNIPQVRPFADSGMLRLVAVTTERRLETLPDIPTVAETVPGFTAATRYGVLAPKGTPPEKIVALNRAFNRSLKYQKFVDAMKAEDTGIVGGTPEEYGQKIAKEIEEFKAAAVFIEE